MYNPALKFKKKNVYIYTTHTDSFIQQQHLSIIFDSECMNSAKQKVHT